MKRIQDINHQIHECQKQLFALGASEQMIDEKEKLEQQFRSHLSTLIEHDEHDIYNVNTLHSMCQQLFTSNPTKLTTTWDRVQIKWHMKPPYNKYTDCTIEPPNSEERGGEPVWNITLTNNAKETHFPRVWGKTQLALFLCLYFPLK